MKSTIDLNQRSENLWYFLDLLDFDAKIDVNDKSFESTSRNVKFGIYSLKLEITPVVTKKLDFTYREDRSFLKAHSWNILKIKTSTQEIKSIKSQPFHLEQEFSIDTFFERVKVKVTEQQKLRKLSFFKSSCNFFTILVYKKSEAWS